MKKTVRSSGSVTPTRTVKSNVETRTETGVDTCELVVRCVRDPMGICPSLAISITLKAVVFVGSKILREVGLSHSIVPTILVFIYSFFIHSHLLIEYLC